MKLNLIASVFLILLLASCTGAAPVAGERIPLKVTFSEQLSYAPLLIAKAEGYFEEVGLDVEYVPFERSSEAVALFVSGDVDVYAGSLNAGFLNTIHESGTIKSVADRGHYGPGGCTYQAILVRRDLYEGGAVTGPQDLAGLTISTSTAGPAAFVMSSYLAQGGLTFADVELVDLDVPAEIDAYATGALDASTNPEPNLTRVVDAGDVVVLAAAEDVVGTLQSGIIAFNEQLLTENRDAGVRFLAAYLKAVRQYNEGKTERNLEILAEGTGFSTQELQAFCWPAMRADASIDFAGVENFQQWSIEQGHLDQAITEEQFWDGSLLQDALQLLD